METKLLNEIHKVLNDFPEYWDGNTLLKNKLIEEIRSYNEAIIEALLSNELVRNTYTIQLSSGLVFKTEDFISMLRYKSYWDNSYTKYTNEVGLTSEGKYLKYNTDVVLDFPHKDSVLEGGMSKEEVGKKEVYYHNVIAKEEIDTLLSPKVLIDIKKIDSNGEKSVENFDFKDNIILKGNNLIALHTLKERYIGNVKLIYIDPPYNTGGDSFKYNDRFNHSTWLTFMKNRLSLARDLLSNDGSIAISIDNNEIAYLLILMDEIFGVENRKNIITIKRGSVTGAKVINPGVVNVSEYVVIYSKEPSSWSPNRIYMSKEWDRRYNKFIVNYEKGYEFWEFKTLLEVFADNVGVKKSQLKRHLGEDYDKKLEEFVYSNSDKIVRLAALDENSISQKAVELKKESLKRKNEVFYMERGSKKPYYVYNGELILFAKDRMVDIDGELTFAQPATDIWDDVLPNDLHNEGGVQLRKGKKPEKLIARLIDLCTNREDIVLDFFVGSGTTAATALKKGRQFIVAEQLDYVNNITTKRIANTINGEQSGISKGVNWQGGGSVVYAELYSLNTKFLKDIQACQNSNELENILNIMKQSAYLNFKVDLEKVTAKNENFQKLSLEEQKIILIQVLDMNQLYLSYSEIEDSQYNISDSVKSFNHSFYQKEGVTNE